MPVSQTRYAGPMVLKKITMAQVDALRGATKREGSQIVYMLMRVLEPCEIQQRGEDQQDEMYTVWVCAKALNKISVCMWNKQLGVSCLQSNDVFPTKDTEGSEKKHSEAYDMAIRDARNDTGATYEEFETAPTEPAPGARKTKTGQAAKDTNDRAPMRPTGATMEKDEKSKSKQTETPAAVVENTVKPVPSKDATPPQKHPDNIDESLLFIFSNLRRYLDDDKELNTRSPAEAWKEMQQGALDVLRFQKKKVCKETWLPTLAKAFKTHVYANDEWRKFADKRMEKARRKGEIADASQEGKAETKEEFVESAQCDEGASKRQKCVDGDVTSALTVTARGGSKNKDEEGNEELLAYLLDQRRFDDGEELGSREAKDVWTHLQTCADRWYTSHMQEPRKAEHQMTLVRAMRGHPMRTDGWGGYALEHW